MVDWRNETGDVLEVTIFDQEKRIILQERIQNQTHFFSMENQLVEINCDVIYDSYFLGNEEFRTLLRKLLPADSLAVIFLLSPVEYS